MIAHCLAIATLATNPTHYGDPRSGCRPDEQTQTFGVPGHACARQCGGPGGPQKCPTDLPANATAAPICKRNSLYRSYCALTCEPDYTRDHRFHTQCGEGATCHPYVDAGKWAPKGLCSYPVPPTKRSRYVGAWASASPQHAAATIAQLKNASWGPPGPREDGLFDRIQLNGCGWHVNASNGTLEVNLTEYNAPGCQEVLKTMADLDLDPDYWVGGLPESVLLNPKKFIDSAQALVYSGKGVYRNLNGIHFDEESECAPRATLKNFTRWLEVMNNLSDAVQIYAGVEVTVAVQAMFGIEDAPWQRNRPCLRVPWRYKTDPKLLSLLRSSKVKRWIEMDTYYFSLSRYLDALDWYRDAIPSSQLGVAVANSNVNKGLLTSPDEYIARAHAWHGSKIDAYGKAQDELEWLNVFMMPVEDQWREHLWRWKTRCEGCPERACFEMEVPCNRSSSVSTRQLPQLEVPPPPPPTLVFSPPSLYGSAFDCAGFEAIGAENSGSALGATEHGFVATVDGGKLWAPIFASDPPPGGVSATVRMPDGSIHNLGDVTTVKDKDARYTTFNSSWSTTVTAMGAGFSFKRRDDKPIVFRGLPQPATCGNRHHSFGCPFRTGGRGSVRLSDGTLIMSIIIYWDGKHANPDPILKPYATSIVAYRSTDDGYTWEYSGTIADAASFPQSEEGPNENDLALLKDGTTILCVIRLDAGDGPKTHQYMPYAKATSNDGGRTWARVDIMQPGVGCARPRLMRFDNGALVLSGGRLSNTNRDVIVWLNAEGDGAWWQAFSISYRHNLLETNASLHFTPTLNASNYRQSMSYTSLVRTGPRTGFVTYGRRLPGTQDLAFAMGFEETL